MSEIATLQAREGLPMTAVGMREGDGLRIAPQNLGEVVKFAEVMSRAGSVLPKHLQGNPGGCMAVTLQALDWRMNPFAVASKSYEVQGRVAYEAQLIAAVVNTRSGIKGRLRYDFEGEGATLVCRVTGSLDGMDCVYETPPIGSITVKNSPLWKSDPRQQLGYFAARSWARRHCPEVILGVYDRDEAQEMRDVTPQSSGLASRLAADPQGGFNPAGVAETLGAGEKVRGATAAQAEASDGPGKSRFSEGPTHDPEVARAGAQAFIDGETREAPSDFSDVDKAAWLHGFDQAQAGAEGGAS